MYQLQEMPEFSNWLASLKDNKTRLRILARLARVENGNFGDHKTVEGDLKELRMTFGGGIRIYYIIQELPEQPPTIILLGYGGTKSKQSKDIAKAKSILIEAGYLDENSHLITDNKQQD